MKMTTHLYAFFTCLAWFSTVPAFSQRQADDFKNFNPRFQVFELPGSALGNSVQAIAQDSTDFLWFDSQGGLHRYDGQNIRTIRHDPAVGKVDVIPQDMGRVLLNLINNAFYAVQQRQRGATQDLPGLQNLEGLYTPTARQREISENFKFSEIYYEPTVTVSTQKTDNQILIKVKDNGTGIPEEVKAKIFQPFSPPNPPGRARDWGFRWRMTLW